VVQWTGFSILLDKIDLPGCPLMKAIDIKRKTVRDGLRAATVFDCSGQLPRPTMLIAHVTRVDILSQGNYQEDFLDKMGKRSACGVSDKSMHRSSFDE
jgi:hypothetical protein